MVYFTFVYLAIFPWREDSLLALLPYFQVHPHSGPSIFVSFQLMA